MIKKFHNFNIPGVFSSPCCYDHSWAVAFLLYIKGITSSYQIGRKVIRFERQVLMSTHMEVKFLNILVARCFTLLDVLNFSRCRAKNRTIGAALQQPTHDLWATSGYFFYLFINSLIFNLYQKAPVTKLYPIYIVKRIQHLVLLQSTIQFYLSAILLQIGRSLQLLPTIRYARAQQDSAWGQASNYPTYSNQNILQSKSSIDSAIEWCF